jgi:hypothetical protein
MDLKPYKFDSHNPRIVTNIEQPTTVYGVAAALFLGSLYLYNKKIFRINQNAMQFLLFTGGSAFASYQYANFFLSSPEIEAGLINNEKER